MNTAAARNLLIRALLERADLREMCLAALTSDHGRGSWRRDHPVSMIATGSSPAAAAPQAAA